MEVSIIKIGNSKGLRLPKTILKKYDIKDSVELVLEEEQIVIKPVSKKREGWDKAFEKMSQKMSQNKEDNPVMDDVFEDEDFEEWK